MSEPSESDIAHREAWHERERMRWGDRKPCTACEGSGWSRSASGHCWLCRGAGQIAAEPAEPPAIAVNTCECGARIPAPYRKCVGCKEL